MNITATFSDDFIDLIDIKIVNDGIVHKKRITVSKFKDILNSTQTKGPTVRINALPSIFINGTFISSETGTLVLMVPKGKQRVSYVKDDTLTIIPLPSLILIFSVEKGLIKDTRVFTTKIEHIADMTDEEPLYNYPLGNVRPYTGEVCWGGNPRTKLSSFKELEYYCQLFINSPTNDDHFTVNQSVKNFKNLKSLFENLKLEEDFNNDLLVPSGATISKFLV